MEVCMCGGVHLWRCACVEVCMSGVHEWVCVCRGVHVWRCAFVECACVEVCICACVEVCMCRGVHA